MTTIRIGRPPQRVRPWRRIALLAVLGVAVTVLATVLMAAAIRELFGYAPIDFTDWLIAMIALVGLASHLAVPGRRERARNRVKSAATRAGMAPESARWRPRLRRLWRVRRTTPGITPLPPVGG